MWAVGRLSLLSRGRAAAAAAAVAAPAPSPALAKVEEVPVSLILPVPHEDDPSPRTGEKRARPERVAPVVLSMSGSKAETPGLIRRIMVRVKGFFQSLLSR